MKQTIGLLSVTALASLALLGGLSAAHAQDRASLQVLRAPAFTGGVQSQPSASVHIRPPIEPGIFSPPSSAPAGQRSPVVHQPIGNFTYYSAVAVFGPIAAPREPNWGGQNSGATQNPLGTFIPYIPTIVPYTPMMQITPGQFQPIGTFSPAGNYSTSSVPSYYFPSYAWSDDVGLLPSIYSLYDGFPGYFSCADSYVIISPPSTYGDPLGSWDSFTYDPFGNASGSGYGDNASMNDPKSSLIDIADSWRSGVDTGIARHLSTSDPVRISFDGKYAYSIGSRDYDLMTRDALKTLATTDFQFSGVHSLPNGDAIGYAQQYYRTPGGNTTNTVYLAYTLEKRSSGPGYKIVAVDSSKNPISGR